MRVLTLARYRFLIILRSPAMTSVFWGVGTLLLLPSAIATASVSIFGASIAYGSHVAQAQASAFLFTWVVHALAALSGTTMLGMGQKSPDDSPASSLVETAPVPHMTGFWGDTLGIFAAAVTIHALWLPLMMFALALSPYATATFAVAECALLAMILLTAAIAAWSLRSETWRLALARLARGLATTALGVTATLLVVARSPKDFGESLSIFVNMPNPATARSVVASLADPIVAALALVALYAALTTFFSLSAVRRAARAE